jgi:ribosomal protection tetracycline resistance protein
MPMPPRPIRTFGILAHVDAGKTTLTERMLFRAGSIRAPGSVDKGTTHTDWLDVERERGISVRSAAATFPWRELTLNLIDTPGHADFSAEVERSLRVLDGAVLVLSAVEGIQAQTAALWQALRAMGLPTLLFINKTDRLGADPDRVLADLQRQFSPLALPLPEPGAAPDPDLLERLAEHDDLLLEHWLEGRPVAPGLLYDRMAALARTGRLFPVLTGSAAKDLGVDRLLDAVADCLPAPAGDPDGPVAAWWSSWNTTRPWAGSPSCGCSAAPSGTGTWSPTPPRGPRRRSPRSAGSWPAATRTPASCGPGRSARCAASRPVSATSWANPGACRTAAGWRCRC